MPILTPSFGSIDQGALASVLGGCGKSAPQQQQQQTMAPIIVCPQAPPPQPIVAAPRPQRESIDTSVQIAGY